MTIQAASSPSCSLPNSSTNQKHYKYEVFLSFRGEDTRSNFTDHLYCALRQKGIDTFIDDKLRRGEEISAALLKAIEDSRISIIVFSENYASSRWCLDELVKILQCRESNQQKVRPVFYKVDPSDVRKQSGSFGEAFSKLEGKFKDSMDKWRAALSEAANLSGWTFWDGEYESQFINKIVEELCAQVLIHSYSLEVAKYPIGLESCIQDIAKLIDIQRNNVHILGIWGTGGIGKTTISKALFNSISYEFEGSCFLADVASNSMAHLGLAQLQASLLFSILGDSNLKVPSVHIGVSLIRKKMRHKKVLLILDDVNDLKQLDNLAPSSDCFGPGSIIIVTTRDKHLLTVHQVHSIYEVKMLDDNEALELFSLNAFKRNRPPNNYLELARSAIRYAQGLPLALIVLGCLLFGRSIEQWEVVLHSYQRVPHKEIQDILKISFDALEDSLKDIFLDIACFFKGHTVDSVTRILEACYDITPVFGIARLQEKALIRIDGDKIWIHDLIEEMGKEIVRQESPDDPGKRSRLWNCLDIYNVLTNNTGTNKIKGIHLQRYRTICLNAKSFLGMENLRYLMISGGDIHISGDIDYLSNELRWLAWPACQLQSLPSGFNPEKLVALSIPQSHITRLWEGFKNFPSLTSMDLSDSKFLTKLPDFSGIPNLKELNLDGCDSLVEVHRSVGSLNELLTLSLEDCFNLEKLPREISLRSVHTIILGNCKKLEQFPKIVGRMDSLRFLNLRGSDIKTLHPSFGKLNGLEYLSLEDCDNLTTLPCSIYELQNLEILGVSGCSKLITFPTNTDISHDTCGSLALPKLKKLRIRRCNLADGDFLMTLDCWETLIKLDLSSNNFVGLPACIIKFVNLRKLELRHCKRLQEIPELPSRLEEVDASDCHSLEKFSNLSNLIEYKGLRGIRLINLWNCRKFCDNLGNNMEKMRHILLNQEKSPFGLVLPGTEVPQWFHCRKEVVANENDSCEISIGIPTNLKWEKIGLAVCSVAEEGCKPYVDYLADISINEVFIHTCHPWRFRRNVSKSDHVWLEYIPLPVKMKQEVDQKGWWPPYKCQVRFYCPISAYSYKLKSCGVHLVCQPPNEYSNKTLMAVEPAHESGMLDWLSWLSSANPQQKRPRTGANDDYHHQQEQQEQPIVMIPSKQHCTEEQRSMPPIPMIDDLSTPSYDYSASASTSDQIFQTSDWQANLDLLPNSQSTSIANLQSILPSTPEFQQ